MICSLSLYPTGYSVCWDCPEQKNFYTAMGLYSPRDMLPTRFQTYQDTTFLVFPRFKCGVAATLMTVRMDDICKIEPNLQPFPSLAANNATAPNGLINVVDIHLDDHDVLWVLDLGVAYTLSQNPDIVSGPKVLALCPRTGQILSKILLCQFLTSKSRLQHLQVEVTEEGTFVYVADAGTATIIVWNFDQQSGFKVCLPTEVTDHRLDKDVLYISLIKKDSGENRLYLTYLMGRKMYYIKTCLLRAGKVEGGVTCVGRKPAPLVVLGTDGGSTLYMRLRADSDIFLWNTEKEFRPRWMVLVEPTMKPRLPTHVAPGYRRLLWSLGSNFYDYMNDRLGSMGPSPKLMPLVKFCDPDGK